MSATVNISSNTISSAQVRAAACRLPGWTQVDLAGRHHVPVNTIDRFERTRTTPPQRTVDALHGTIEGASVECLGETSSGPGVRFRTPGFVDGIAGTS